MSAFLEKELVGANHDVKEISKDILFVNNFISKNEIDSIFQIINNTDNEEWFKEYLGNLKSFCLEKFGRDDVENLVAEGKFEITQNWEDKNLNIQGTEIQDIIFHRLDDLVKQSSDTLFLSGFATIQRMQEGVSLTAHTDQHTDPSIRYATILYLNDDYMDGEIFFENQNVRLKPPAGALLVFPGTEDFHHGVEKVGPGPIRYVLVGFIKEKDFYKHNRY